MNTGKWFTPCVFALILFGAPCSYAGGVGQDGIRQYCKDDSTKAGTLDQRLYDYCLKRQSESIAEIKSIGIEFKGKTWFEKFSGPNCFKNWTKRDIVNYEMVAHCMKSEKEGFLDTKYQIEKKNKNVGVDCLVTALGSENPMQMTAYCIKNYTPRDKATAESAIAQYVQDNPKDRNVKSAREMFESVGIGKQDMPMDSTTPPLPDVAGLTGGTPSISGVQCAPEASVGTFFRKKGTWLGKPL